MFPSHIQMVIDQVDRLREKVDDHWQIPADQGRLLAQLARLHRARSICEIGTSYGFSTLHLAAAVAETKGHVHTVDIDPKKTKAATEHLQQARLLDRVTLHTGDAREVIKDIAPAEPFDFVFIDATKDQSQHYLEVVLPKLARRAVLITDNTKTHQKALEPFVNQLRSLEGARGCQVDVGNGFDLTLLER